ncbi:MAG: DsrE/DsrF/DrsH-like family protein [Polyangiaceae bacterium]|nr:DsrE/DsrF/DrsH-like family protein [Polyangiaceae bacterium]
MNQAVDMSGPESESFLDCRGMLCPAPILRLAETARRKRGTAAILTICADDADFPVDLEAWCRTTKSSLVRLERESDGVIRAVVQLQGPAPAVSGPATLPAIDSPPSGKGGIRSKTPEPPESVTRVSASELKVRQEESPTSPGVHRSIAQTTPLAPYSNNIQSGRSIRTDTPVPRSAGAALPSQVLSGETESVPRENRTTLLILKNDLESLLAALMVANASAAQGMRVDVYFSFWGIHLLRGRYPRNFGQQEKPTLMQRIMLWLTPKGANQRLSRLHMGGFGTRILLGLMRRKKILSLEQLLEAAAEQGVTFHVCSMSMGLMGLSERDIVDLPNVKFGGVTSFAESARRSAVALVF